MKLFTMNKKSILSIVIASTALLTACDDKTENPIPTPEDERIEKPNEYAFESRFEEGVSSVDYGGQVVRQLLVQDISILIDKAAETPSATLKEDIQKLFDHLDEANLKTITPSIHGADFLEVQYNQIATGKNIKDKISGQKVIGFPGDKTAEILIFEWVDKIQQNISEGKAGKAIYIDEDTKVDYKQLIGKVLTGALIYSQGADNYLSKAQNEDNSKAAEGKNYSTMEHVWDEAFGYFGAVRDYYAFSDEDHANKTVYKDTNGDGKIDFHSEYNFALSRNAGKRDKDHSTDFTTEIFDAFLEGRTAIVNKEANGVINEAARKAAQGWEKVIVATAIHYINEVLIDMENEPGSENHSKHWSELKGFLIALQYGAKDAGFMLMDLNTLEAIHDRVGTEPIITNDEAYKGKLLEVREDLGEIYGFSATDLQTW
ncbi:DUF4856 domain-containing protein [Xanthovirga aplysinae]|uniref:DUF4856 domain-containing protein n=1 Tax=Xanthovirga aplysinae TaxID=2529853 RepID=UPI0012BC6FED|nr:DUF4856 domain-containing protein [Xanthovirga aplysinae]MTI32199.1 DUF4856 domain-containing protein [Xanthovirga aplysinae]